MADKITYSLEKEKDIYHYKFDLGKNHCKFDVVSFNSIYEYENFLEDKSTSVFRDFPVKNLKLAGYDWNIEKNEKVNIFKLIRTIEIIGKDYVTRNWPDIIFYKIIDTRLHNIYKRMFFPFGYELLSIQNYSTYIYFRYVDSKDKNGLEINYEIYE